MAKLDRRVFDWLHISPPSPFADKKQYARVAQRLWAAVSEKGVWDKFPGRYPKIIEAAKYCEDRANR